MSVTTQDAQLLKGAIRSDVKTWHVLNLPNSTAAVEFVNTEPRQVAGEFVPCERPDGTVDVYFFL